MNSTLRKTSLDIVNQLIDFLQQLPDDIYTTPLPLLSDSTVAKHIRHIVEFYECVYKGISTGIINYDARLRNVLLETDKTFCINKLQHITNLIGSVTFDKKLNLQMGFSDADKSVHIESSLSRELVYAMDHAIHHMAIIRMAIKSTDFSIELPQTFGVAFSTIQYQASTCSAN